MGGLVRQRRLQLLALADRVHQLLDGGVQQLAQRAGQRLGQHGGGEVAAGHGAGLGLDAPEGRHGHGEGGGHGAGLARAGAGDLHQVPLADLGGLVGQPAERAGDAAPDEHGTGHGGDDQPERDGEQEVAPAGGRFAVGGGELLRLADGVARAGR